ncbi:MAG: TrmH family RNA methyltransferase [Candidatus Komeilibacteria bacterium]
MEKIIIKAKDNSHLKQWRKLQHKKYRDVANLFVVENEATISDALLAGYQPEALAVTNSWLKNHQPIFKSWSKTLILSKYFIISAGQYKSISGLSNGAGILAVYQQRKESIEPQQSVVYLNGVSDPGNVGTILRTMVAFGWKNIVLDEECADMYNPKTVSAAKDAMFKLNYQRDKNAVLLSKLRSQLTWYVTSLQGEDMTANYEVKQPMGLILGNEGQGVAPAIAAQAEHAVRLPLSGNMESLNVGVAAGILLYLWRPNK